MWSFGDGGQSAGSGPSHTYQSAGNYDATLTVDDGRGGSDTATVTVAVSEPTSGGGDGLVNGDFEGAVQAGGVGEGWTSYSTEGYGATFDVVSDDVHGGTGAQWVLSPQPPANDRFAGVYQVVDASPGIEFTVRAWSKTRFEGGNSWDHIALLGIDRSVVPTTPRARWSSSSSTPPRTSGTC